MTAGPEDTICGERWHCSSDIRTILAGKEDGTSHAETVSRVMNFLDDFGQDDVKIVTRHGKRRVVFTDAAANRYHRLAARNQTGTETETDITGVVMGARDRVA